MLKYVLISFLAKTILAAQAFLPYKFTKKNNTYMVN
jgi:hypothetical protein